MFERKSLTWPITLGIIMIVLTVGLTIGWILLNVFGALESRISAGFYWTLLSIGSVMFAFVLTGVVMYLVLSIKQHNLTARQSNFIDAVTHELKTPIASLKLYLQTLNRRSLDEMHRQQFYNSMLVEVDRLDQLINQLLDVARLSHPKGKSDGKSAPVAVDRLIAECLAETCRRHRIAPEAVDCRCEPIRLDCRRLDLEIIFRNLIDNAAKYSGNPPRILVTAKMLPGSNQMIARVENNGASIPRAKRRLVFERFYRLGNELERTKPGAGLGLFLVKLLVRQMRGKIAVVDSTIGTAVEMTLPGASLEEVDAKSGQMESRIS